MNQAMSVLTSQGTTEWYTPAWIVELARETMGGIDLDPASSVQAQRTVNAETFYTAAQDGYRKAWLGRVWLNPPFDETPRWVRRLGAAYADGDVSQAVLLVNSAPGYRWWEELYRAFPVCLLRERVAFVRADGTSDGTAKKGTTIAYMGAYWSKFDSVWSSYGRVLLP
jgi:phage N-6-adenine-methyltransferase